MPQAGPGKTLFVVGIGASAGGLEAVTELLGAVPAATGMAFILVQHLDPSHESLLSEILAKKTTIPVSEALAGEVVCPDHVYVIPPDAILAVHDGRIELKPREEHRRTPLSYRRALQVARRNVCRSRDRRRALWRRF